MSYCICISGYLGRIVFEHLLANSLDISVVLTDSHSTDIIDLAYRNDIQIFIGNPRSCRALNFVIENSISFDNILSINYLFILEECFLQMTSYLAINFHGSLLPKYRGRTPHVWAIINGETMTGVTAHLMDSKCDNGDVVKQVELLIDPDDTGYDILEKFNLIYPKLVIETIRNIEQKTLKFAPQNHSYATYFGKRTPEDGRINWDWQKERIRNWIRAQACPYPGAFTYLRGNKIIINKVQYSSIGYNCTEPNGLVLQNISNPIIKTSNGAIEFIDYCCIDKINKNDILI